MIKKSCDFLNFLMKQKNGERLILNLFAERYLSLKEKKIFNNEEYGYLNEFFKELGLVPQRGDNGVINYSKLQKNIEKKDKYFFKRKNLKEDIQEDCSNCDYKYICVNSKIRNKGEENLVKDIFFDLKQEIDNLMYNF